MLWKVVDVKEKQGPRSITCGTPQSLSLKCGCLILFLFRTYRIIKFRRRRPNLVVLKYGKFLLLLATVDFCHAISPPVRSVSKKQKNYHFRTKICLLQNARIQGLHFVLDGSIPMHTGGQRTFVIIIIEYDLQTVL